MGKNSKKNKNKERKELLKKMQEKGSTPCQKEENSENSGKEKNDQEQKGSIPPQEKNPEKEKSSKEQKDTTPSEKPKPSSSEKPVGGGAGPGAASSAPSTSTSLLGPGPRPGPVAQQKLQQPPKAQRPPKPKSLEDKVDAICRLLSEDPDVDQLGPELDILGIKVTTELVEEVLKNSYKAGEAALKFFHWSVNLLGGKHSPYAWNLLVDVLGNNKMFDAMWDVAKSMKADGILSRQTFATIFTSYAMAEKANEAMMTFEVMEHYGCPQDVGAFNCLLCALCRCKQTTKALEFCKKMGDKFPPDADTYAILLEGWEKEGNAAKAKKTFGEMIARLGWDPLNTAAYNAFLGTLCKLGQVDEALKFLHVMRSRNCFPDKSFFSTAVHALCLQNRADEAAMVFETMLRCGHIPSTTTYNSMISAYCYAGRMDDCYRLFDGMVFNGAFPDSVTYNTIFQTLIKARKEEEAASIFREMIRNEHDPDSDSYTMALVVKDLNMASMVWKHMSSKGSFPSMESANIFINSLCDSGKRAEALKYVEEMRDQGIKVSEEILKRVKISESEKKDTAERSSKKRKERH